jgi:hypothetical protein
MATPGDGARRRAWWRRYRGRERARENRQLTLVPPGRSESMAVEKEEEAMTMVWMAWLAEAPNRAAPFFPANLRQLMYGEDDAADPFVSIEERFDLRVVRIETCCTLIFYEPNL